MANAEDGGNSLLDPAVLAGLLEQLQGTDVDEVEIEFGDSRLYLRRDPGKRAILAVDAGPASVAAGDGIPITAPLTGVFYGRPSPDEDAFVTAGSHVEAGQVVALIETMKLFNEVMSEISGEVLSLAVRDGDLVDVGQPLMFVRPSSEGNDE